MKLTKQFAAISVAATATVLFSAGGAHAQGDGEFLSSLGNTTLQRISYPVQIGDGNSYIGTQNINTNNNSGKGIANNNNNNNNGNGNGGRAALQEISYPVQLGNGNNFIGTQNINTNNNTGAGTYNNNNNNNNGSGTFNNNNNNNNGGVANNNNNNNGNGAHRHANRAMNSGKLAPLLNAAARINRQSCSSQMGQIGQSSAVISGAMRMYCAQN
ncbi:hypothetical protein [Streptomyces sp. SPB4]|uniref:hypothetical protein n=1 Tax=Streptomyces TaxID=1883 RepID=UPI002474216F|nr:hypothetical protein [Streptomyces sp. SPB4]MDH6541450.1 hypothetical protein [Streptomyces sp. SPB4]